jgi:hypothetical protein
VASGAHDLHGLYMTVPGLLRHVTTGEIAALAAPRPQLACVGLRDPLTPPDAVDIAMAGARAGYDVLGAGAMFEAVIGEDAGHAETEAMREAVIDFLKRRL